MLAIIKYYIWTGLTLTNGVLGMMLLLAGQTTGLFCLFVATLLHSSVGKIKEEAIINMGINRAGYIVAKMTDENTPSEDAVKIFRTELTMFLEKNKIKDADSKSKEISAIFKSQF